MRILKYLQLKLKHQTILYHAQSSYYSMIARLVLEEKQFLWETRLMNIHRKTEQFQPWYAKLSPTLTVPTLLMNGVLIPGSDRILHAVAEELEGPSLIPADSEAKARMDAIIAKHYSIEIEDLTFGYLMSVNPVMRIIFTIFLGKTIHRFKVLSQRYPDLAEVYTHKEQQNLGRLKKFSDVKALFATTFSQVEAFLDEIEMSLSQQPDTSYICGSHYSQADILITVFLARLNWLKPTRELIKQRPNLSAYWVRMQARPSFLSADIWPKPSIVRMIRSALF